MQQKIHDTLKQCTGSVSFYYKNLVTGEEDSFRATQPMIAASVIKIPVLIEAFCQMEGGTLSFDEEVAIQPHEKMPSCGVLAYLHNGLRVTLRDLCVLMIIVSDNTATNLLINRLGMDAINRTMRALGFKVTTVRRLLFDRNAAERGLQNHICAQESGSLLTKLYRGEIVSAAASAEMLSILKQQQLNGKIPFALPSLEIAHKTGEDDGITHDVGVVYAKRPFVVCFCSNNTDVPAFERVMQDCTRLLFEQNNN